MIATDVKGINIAPSNEPEPMKRQNGFKNVTLAVDLPIAAVK